MATPRLNHIATSTPLPMILVVFGLALAGCEGSAEAPVVSAAAVDTAGQPQQGRNQELTPSQPNTPGIVVGDDGEDADSGEEEQVTHLGFSLSNEGLHIIVEYEIDALLNELEIDVRGGHPNEILEVMVRGVAVLALELNSSGRGYFELSTHPEPGQSPLPASFPRLDGGDRITIGGLTGTLGPK